jgi:hypothetical protein
MDPHDRVPTLSRSLHRAVRSRLVGIVRRLRFRYEAVNAMLLNEFLKEHRKVEEQGAMIAKQQKQIEALTATVQKVSDQVASANLHHS